MMVRVPAFHLITNDEILSTPEFVTLASTILTALPERIALHLRAQHLTAASLYALAEQLCNVARSFVLINDRIDVAAATNAAGVQLGTRSLPIAEARRILGPQPAIGYSAHAPEEAARAEAEGANFLLLGTIYRSASHLDQPPAGIQLVANSVRYCRVPIFAIGGVTTDKVAEVMAAGASGVAVIRAVWKARDPVQAAHDFVNMLHASSAERPA